MWDVILALIIVAFLVWEVTAHFVFHNRGIHTLSNRIVWLHRRHPKVRVATAVVLLVLALHLIVNWI
jgi:hypothetical protein